MGDSNFRPAGAPKPLNPSSWNLAWLITSHTWPHMPKLIYGAFGVYGGGRGEVATSRAFFICYFLVSWVRLQSSLYKVARRSMYHKTCFGGHYIPSIQFRFKGQSPPIYTPKTAFWGHLKLKSSLSQVFTYISTTDKAIFTKLHRNIKQGKYYIKVWN